MGSRGASSGIEVKGVPFIKPSDATPLQNYKRGELKFYVDVDGQKHYDGDPIDNEFWKLNFGEHKPKELEDAKWLESLLKEKVYLNPTVNVPKGTSSCDYVTESGLRIEQKGPSDKPGNDKIERLANQGKKQAKILLINITGLNLSKKEVDRQVNNALYKNNSGKTVNQIIVKDGDKLVGWYKK